MRRHGAVAKRAAWRRHCAQSLADFIIRQSMSMARASRPTPPLVDAGIPPYTPPVNCRCLPHPVR